MKKIIVIGAGFVGVNFLSKIAKSSKNKYHIILFDKNNHHVFQPMLYQAATAFIPLNNVVVPIRKLFTQKNIEFKMEEVVDILPSQQLVETSANNLYSYDYLIVATGIQYDYFGNDDWRKYTFSLKSAYDAQKIKSHILNQFELAEVAQTSEEKKYYLTFIIIGAGATGVEITGALLDLLHTDFLMTYHNFSIDDISIHLIEGGENILSAFPKELSNHAYNSLKKRKVNIHLKETVTNILKDIVTTEKNSYQGATIIWSTTLKGKGLGNWMSNQIEKGKISVLGDLTHPDFKNIYFAGDISYVKNKPLPGLASVAKQQGKYIAKTIIKREKNKKYKNFKYKDLGTMAIIKRHEAIANIFGMKFKGKLGWFIWGGVHIAFLISIRNKFVVSFNWLSYYICKRIGSIEFIKLKESKKGK
ncbi:NADH dehydrogenase family protein [Francisella opportunistica]|uniref:NADH:ubiquinone reductase (non-electrogenic) n=1 Tax=Francisella opportunistica TaxID=2016517 RepID=A0A345JR51_9GAMM|nr:MULTISPECIES: NAD(P)/FAD-dependent oxidoreductase [Francisella]APC91516.1 NADH dehydrogenase [Francisella sp. MA067296]AXH29797.1 NAD(P)/FAD-dependent oxidoreductase [Francisella opportunistica]AXH31447.1 NADH dehydrogenase family protein [Francisella opportunistica]AXH33093.1 NADH dehydrogenase family protein [Francisella opportunistica]